MKAQITPWILAARPKTLTAALIPILVATALAAGSVEFINWRLSVSAFLTAVFIQIGTNLFNDALDFKKGADTPQRVGPIRVTQSGMISANQVLAGAVASFGFATLFALPMIFAGGMVFCFILALSLLFGYLYTGGPYPLAYYGLGDLFVLVFFGFVATGAVYYLQIGEINRFAILAGAEVGLLSTVMIAINNLRDINQDKLANKNTLAVKFGKTFAKVEISILLLLPFALNLFWVASANFPAALLPLITLPIALTLLKGIWQNEPGPIYNRYLGASALLHMLFGLLLSFGLYFFR